MNSTFDRGAPHVLSLLRIVAALLLLEHGTQKILGFPAGMHPSAFSLPWTAGILELVGGTLLLFGLLSRPLAFLLSGEMAVGYFLAHAPKSPFPALNDGDAKILFCFVFLYISASGPGPWSVDAQVRRAPI